MFVPKATRVAFEALQYEVNTLKAVVQQDQYRDFANLWTPCHDTRIKELENQVASLQTTLNLLLAHYDLEVAPVAAVPAHRVLRAVRS